MAKTIQRIIAAQRLRELMLTAFVGDLLHDLKDRDTLDLAQKLAARLGELARADDDNG